MRKRIPNFFVAPHLQSNCQKTHFYLICVKLGEKKVGPESFLLMNIFSNSLESFYPRKTPKLLLFIDNGVINVRQGFEVLLHVYGFGLTNDSEVKLTSSVGGVGQPCKSQELHVQTTR